MKICHLTCTRQDAIPRIIRESNSSVKYGFETVIISIGESYTKDGVTYKGIKKPTSRLNRMLITSREIYKQALAEDADIYQIHDPELLLYAKRLKKRGKVVVFDSHEFYGIQIQKKEYLPSILRNAISKLYMSYEAYICRAIDAVIAVCTVNGENYFEDHPNKMIFLENLPDDNFKNDNIDYSEEPKKYTAVYAGAISHQRGISHLIKAIYKVNGKLALCGPISSEEYFENLKKTEEFSCVDYKGVVAKEDVVKIISQSHIGISTLLHEGQYSQIDTLPTKVYEYMSLKKPVIISDTAYAKKILANYEFGITVKPDNINDIAEAVNYLLKNNDDALRMGEIGIKAVKEVFNWSVEEKKLIELYNQLYNEN